MRLISRIAFLFVALAALEPTRAGATCTGNDAYSRMICATGNVAHYYRMNSTSASINDADLNGPSYTNAPMGYVNTGDVTVQTTGLVPSPNTDKSVTFGGATTNPGFAGNNISTAELTPKASSNWTLELWFKASSLSGTRYLATVADSLQYNHRLYASNSGSGKLQLLVWNGTPGTCNSTAAVNITAANAFSTATAYYVVAESATSAGTWATNGAKLYVNNSLEVQGTGSGNVCSNDHRFYVAIEGQDRNGQFAGVIDDVVIYDRILTAQERFDHYQGYPTGASGAVRRVIEGRFREPRIAPPDRLLAGLPKLYLNETGPAIAAINELLLTGAPSQYEKGP